jgi:small subunit ribosomal protein S6e
MILNIAYPQNGTQIKQELKEEKFYNKLMDHKLGDEVSGDLFGFGLEGCVFKITGGSDNTGFAMKQGVLTKNKKKLLLAPGTSGYRARREGTHRRKTVRGCVIGREITSLNLVLISQGEKNIAGLTDVKKENRLGPKRANKIRKLFSLPKHSDNINAKDAKKITVSNIDVQQAVVKRITKEVDGKKYYKAPRISRLLSNKRLRRKRVKTQQKIKKLNSNQELHKAFLKKVEAKKNEVKK